LAARNFKSLERKGVCLSEEIILGPSLSGTGIGCG
jgi:hypothetical protein